MSKQKRSLGRALRRKLAAALVTAVAMTSIFPSYAFAASADNLRYYWYIADEDEGTWDDEEELATASDAEYATWSNAVLTAMDSFNSEVTFVDSKGNELKWDGDQSEMNPSDFLSVPQDNKNFPYLSQQKGRTREDIGFAERGYVEHEYFLKGQANLYDVKDKKLAMKGESATPSNAAPNNAEEYINRIIVFKPEDVSDFNGVVFVDILNASSKTDIASLWRQSYDYIMESGYAYVGITSKDVTAASLKTFNKDRYGVLDWGSDNGLFWDMLGQLGTLIKAEDSPILYGEETGSVNSYVFGSSQSGWYVNTFVNNFGLANFMVDDAADLETQDDYESAVANADHIFDGYLNFVGGMMDTAICNKQSDGTRMFAPVKATDVPFILLVGENDYNPGPVRQDSNAPDNMYRHYVIAGGPHSDIIFPADPTDELQMRTGRDTREYAAFKGDHTVTDFNITVFINAALENLHNWSSDGAPAPRGPSKDEINGKMAGMAFAPVRDQFGNMDSGIISPQISVPVAAYYGGANGAWSDKHGSMVYLSDEIIEELYGDRETYLGMYEEALNFMIGEGWILNSDYDTMMAIAESEPIFGAPGRDAEAVEASMEQIPWMEELDVKEDHAGLIQYKDSTFLVRGDANIYTSLNAASVVRMRQTTTPYVNFMRMAVPDNFSGEVVIDLILDSQEATKDIVKLMRQGKAYVGITATPKTAQELGGSWKKEVNANTRQDEFGLLWDIISQTVTSLKYSDELNNPDTHQDLMIQLGMDSDERNIVYTYDMKFSSYDCYSVTPYEMDEAEELPLHGSNIDPAAKDEPDEPDEPDKPDEPDEPDEPDKPDEPDEPDEPDTPVHSGGGGGGGSYSGSASSAGVKGTWSQNAEGRWTFVQADGTAPASCWLLINWNGKDNWYYFNADGTMAAGWICLDGIWYYLHAESDADQGSMYVGWHLIGDKWYYFHDVSDGTRGRMLADTTTPDGYKVGADGVWIQ